MEKILTAVPFPVTGDLGLTWGTVCMDHPAWLGVNEPTDTCRESAEAFANAQACAHPTHFGVTEVHVVSATAIVVAGRNHHLAMCGEDMGPYREIPPCHPVGNYLWSGSPLWKIITCAGCLERCGRS